MSSSLTVRPAGVEDCAQMARVNVRCWQETYRGLMSDAVLDDPGFLAARERFWTAALTGERYRNNRVAVAERDGDLPGNLVSAVVGREFLVPTDDEWDEFDLLREAVDLVGSKDYRNARQRFHAAMLGFVRDQRTDYDSIKGAAEAMERELEQLDQLARKRRRWRRAERGFFFSQMAIDVATAPVNPLSLVHAGIGVGAYTTSDKLGDPASPQWGGPAGALLHDAQGRLGLTPGGERAEATALQRLREVVFGRQRSGQTQ